MIGGIGLALAWGFQIGFSELSRFAWMDLVWGVVCTLPPLIAFFITCRWPIGPFIQMRHTIESSLATYFHDCTIWHFAAIAAAAGIGEEALFRGFIQPLLESWTTTGRGLVLASALFGFLHPITRTYIVSAAIIGVYLGWIWLVFDRHILVPITVHALYDLVALLFLSRSAGIKLRWK